MCEKYLKKILRAKFLYFCLFLLTFVPVYLFALPTRAQAALTDNIESFWKLDEADGLTRNDSVGSNHLTNNNNVTQITGKIDNASHFTSSSSQSLSRASNASLSTGDIDYSLSAWVYLDSTGVVRTIINKDDTGAGREYVLYYTGTAFRFIAFNGTSTVIGSVFSSFGTLNANTWYFVAAYHSATSNQVGISVNGGAFDTAATTGAAGSNSTGITIGGTGGSGFWNGRIDAVGFWKKVLTSGEVAQLYNSGTGVEYPFLIFDAIPPTITSVSSTKSNGSYSTGDVIPINVTFSEPVLSTGNVTVTLETGTTDRTCTFTITNSSSGSCNYTVQSGDSSADLALVSISGTIADANSNALVNFTPAATLADNKDLSINIVAPITQSLQAFWKLDEASGVRADSYGSNNLTSNNSVGQTTGKIGNAASFVSSSSQYLSVTDNTNLSTGSGTDFTISGWVYLSTKSAAQVFISKYTTTAVGEYAVYYQSSTDRFAFSTYGNNTSYDVLAHSLGSPATGTWYFIVATHNASTNTNTIRVNDTYQDSVTSAEHLDSTSDFNIGRFTSATLYTNGAVDAVGFWKRVLTSSEITTVYNSGNGSEYPFTPPADSISITTPTDYRTYQRNSNNQASITVSGTYNGSPTAIEASWNGGSYQTIVASPTGGTFTGTLSNMPAGQGTLTVRFTNDTSVSASKQYVGVGDIFVIAGQSNADGYGQNNHSYTSPSSNSSLKASLFGNDDTWKNLADPVDSNSGQVDAVSSGSGTAGSVWPFVATHYLEDQGVPVAFIPTSQSGTALSAWQRNNSNPGSTSTLYGSMYRRINAVGGVKAVLFWQGESDVPSTSQATYTSLLNTFANDVASDFGVKTVVAQIGDWSAQPGSKLDNIRLAQKDVWESNSNVVPGPSLYDVVLSVDGLHFKTNAEQQTAADRWWVAIEEEFFNGSDGRGPQIAAVEYNSAKTQIRLTFSDNTLPLLPTSSLGGITVKDDGVSASISSINRTAINQLTATLASAASGTITVSLGEGRTGTGATVPKDSSSYNLPGEIFVNRATTLIDETAPIIFSVASSTTNSGASITWTTDENSSSIVEYGTTGSYGTSTSETDTSSRVTNHTVTLSGLSSCTTYHYRVKSSDVVSNQGVGTDSTFITGGCTVIQNIVNSISSVVAPVCNAQAPGDKAPWLYSAIPQSGNSVLLYFTEADDPVNSYALEFGTKSGEYPYAATHIGGKGARTYLVQSLSPNTTYYFRVRGGNGCATGNWSNELSAKTKSLFSLNQLQINTSTISNSETQTIENEAGINQSNEESPDTTKNLDGYVLNIKVTDNNHQPIGGAKVTIHSTVQEATTDELGIARFTNVESGDHKVFIAYKNFEGEQSLNLTGDVKEFNLSIVVEQKNVLTSPVVLAIISAFSVAVLMLLFLLLRARAKS